MTDMDDIRKFILENEESFSADMPEKGDSERFFSRLGTDRVHLRRMAPPRRISLSGALILPAAAALLLFMVLRIYVKALPQPDSEENIYLNYRTELLNLTSEIIQLSQSEDDAMENERIIGAIDFEAVPMAELLPECIATRERICILKEYYSRKLDGVRLLRDRLSYTNTH